MTDNSEDAGRQPRRGHGDDEERERFFTEAEMREVALGIARRLLEWEGHEAPPAYTRKALITEPLVEAEAPLPPVDVNEERYEPEPPRARVGIGMWLLAAEVSVEHQAASGELLAWRNRSEALKQGPKTIDKARAIALAEALVGELPRGADGPMASEMGEGANERAFQVSWAHFAPENVLVDGDLLLVRVSATTGRPYTLFRKWRVVPDEQEAPAGDALPGAETSTEPSAGNAGASVAPAAAGTAGERGG